MIDEIKGRLEKGKLLTVIDINTYFNLGQLKGNEVFSFEHYGD